MRHFSEPIEEREETNYWMPVSNILGAAVLVLLVLLAVFAAYLGSGTRAVQQTSGQTQQAVTAETSAVPASDKTQDEREAALTAREKAVAESEAALREMAGARPAIVTNLTDGLKGLKLPIEIEKATGDIRFTEAVLFDVNKDTLNPVGQRYLDAFVPAYLSALFGGGNAKYVEQIIIEGHADNGGTYQYNLELSQKRADSVVAYIISRNLAKMADGTDASKYFTVGARSFNDPVLTNGKADANKSRRVEFVFRLKDEK